VIFKSNLKFLIVWFGKHLNIIYSSIGSTVLIVLEASFSSSTCTNLHATQTRLLEEVGPHGVLFLFLGLFEPLFGEKKILDTLCISPVSFSIDLIFWGKKISTFLTSQN